MDLKDVILSTLAELEHVEEPKPAPRAIPEPEPIPEPKAEARPEPTISITESESPQVSTDDELRFLTSLRERILVLFEGLQSPNNRNLEAKVDLILNFLEYQLAMIDARMEHSSQGTTSNP